MNEKNLLGKNSYSAGVKTPGRTGEGGNIHTGIFLCLMAASLMLMLMTLNSPVRGAVKVVDEGIKFTYYDPNAGKVFLAGSFNNWSTTQTPMNKNQEGTWSTTLNLDPGEHEYKFVVDGAWITDMENPNTKSDPYGGMNSIVEINSQGEIVVSGEGEAMRANTALSAQVHFSGRYLNRTEIIKGQEDDQRWRMQRPQNKFDMNFDIMISEIVHGYSRLRVDSEKNFLEPNNISAILDETHIEITPGQFEVTGYYSEEILESRDPLMFFGDEDLAGTIFDDHLKSGKGTAGITGNFSSYGFDVEGFFSNVHDYDIYNDPDLFDNTGTDLYAARITRDFDPLVLGANFFMTRNMWWLDFTEKVGTDPVNTGIESLDEHINRTGDPSDWFELDDKSYNLGLDLTAHLYQGDLVPQFEFLAGEMNQTFVTSNSSGIDLGNGPIDVPIMQQDQRIYHGSIRSTLVENLLVNAEHTRRQHLHSQADETRLTVDFKEQEEANKHIFYTLEQGPAAVTHDYSELFLQYGFKSGTLSGLDVKLWLQRNMYDYDNPGDQNDQWRYNWSLASGLSWKPISRLNVELEQQYVSYEGSSSIARNGSELETILRGNYKLSDKLSAFLDIRTIHLESENGPDEDESGTFTSPFIGFKYLPAGRVSLLLAYGLDPMDFSIDYQGRRIGRYLYRNSYIYNNTGSTVMDAEEALSDLNVITLRAVFNF